MKKIIVWIIATLLLGTSLQANSSGRWRQPPWVGVVTHVTDGDSLWVRQLSTGQAQEIRIAGIDAPEICQTYGPQSAQALFNLVQRKTVTVRVKTQDKYGRFVAAVELQGQDVAAWLVSHGLAWSYHSRRSMGPYGAQELAARQAGLGLWGLSDPIEPKFFRRAVSCYR